MVARIPTKYADAVQDLARCHARELGNGVTIFSMPDPSGKNVRLLEVTGRTVPSDPVIAIPFAPSKTFPFRSLIVQVTPAEWKRIRSGDMTLPEGWNLGELRKVWPSA